MKIIDQSFEIDHFDPEEDVRSIVKAARTCYEYDQMKTFKERCDFIEKMRGLDKENPHESPLEQSRLGVVFITNRGITHELVRHRLTSPNQESTRYCRYDAGRFGNNVTFIRDIKYEGEEFIEWMEDCRLCEERYFRRLNHGHSADEARGVLNNDVKARITISANYREWRHIFKLRTSPKAHYMMVDLMTPLRDYMAQELPCIFGDLVN